MKLIISIVAILLFATTSFAQRSFYADTVKFDKNECLVNNIQLMDSIKSECVISITGYASVEGSSKSNLELSRKRAKSVSYYIATDDFAKITWKGETNMFGSSLEDNRIVIIHSDKACVDSSIQGKDFDFNQLNGSIDKSNTETIVKKKQLFKPVIEQVKIGEIYASNDSINNTDSTEMSINTELIELEPVQLNFDTNLDSILFDTSKIEIDITDEHCDCNKQLAIRELALNQYLNAKQQWLNSKKDKDNHYSHRVLMHESQRYYNAMCVEARACQYKCFKDNNKLSEAKPKVKSTYRKVKTRRVSMRPTRGKSGRGLARLFPYINC